MKKSIVKLCAVIIIILVAIGIAGILKNNPKENGQGTNNWTPVKSIDFSSKHHVMIKNDDGSLTPMDVPYFRSTRIAPGTWQILADGDYCYLVEGDDEAVMIDTGYGAGNIREYCQSLTNKPLRNVINTHYHFDHTANNAYFDRAYMAADTKPNATIPYPSFAGIDFPRDYPTVIIGEGYKYQLGNRELEVIEIPNHTPGGIALLDRRERLLFSGDEVMGKSLLLNCSVAQFAQNMSKLVAHRSEFDTVGGGPGVMDAAIVDQYLAAAKYILSGEGTPEKVQPRGETQTAADPSGQKVYLRKRVRAEDRGDMAAKEANQYLVKMTYGDCTLTYDSRRLTD